MGKDWIIDVLADLRSFARENDLPLLADQLDDACLIAEVEIANHADRAVNYQTADADGQRPQGSAPQPTRRA